MFHSYLGPESVEGEWAMDEFGMAGTIAGAVTRSFVSRTLSLGNSLSNSVAEPDSIPVFLDFFAAVVVRAPLSTDNRGIIASVHYATGAIQNPGRRVDAQS